MVGRIRRLPLKEVWRHEAHDFTRWLEANLDVLNEALGLDLTLAEREQSAGDFSDDPIAEDGSGHAVVIENQLEKSNHDHLGKLITYLSVMEARCGVDGRRRPTRASDRHRFGSTYHAPSSTWSRRKRSPSATPSPPRCSRSSSVPARKRANSATPGAHSPNATTSAAGSGPPYSTRPASARGCTPISPSTESWVSAGAGLSGLAFNYVTTQRSSRVELYIDRGDAEEKQRVYEHFATRPAEIEQAFGGPLDWQPLPNRRACRIAFEVTDQGYRDEDAWPQIHAQLVDAMIRLEETLKPHIARLR